MDKLKQTEEIIAAVDYTTSATAHSNDQIYEIAKNMNQEQLLQLIGSILDASKQKEQTIAKQMVESNSYELAIKYANTTEIYIKTVQDATFAIAQNNVQLNNENSSLSNMFR